MSSTHHHYTVEDGIQYHFVMIDGRITSCEAQDLGSLVHIASLRSAIPLLQSMCDNGPIITDMREWLAWTKETHNER